MLNEHGLGKLSHSAGQVNTAAAVGENGSQAKAPTPAEPGTAVIREHNRKTVLTLVRQHDSSSRAELASQAGLSVVTTAKILKQLESDGLISETAAASSGLGRPASRVELRADGGYVVGLLPRATSTHGVVMNLRGTVVHAKTWKDPIYGIGDRLVEILGRRVDELMEASGLGADAKVLGVGIGCPGLLDAADGRIIESWALGYKDLELARPLERRLNVPVIVDNDVNCLAGWESSFGALQDSPQSLVVSVGTGIGLGIVIDGLVYRGQFGMAGDIGHSPLLGSKRRCKCGRRGCLEGHVSDHALVVEYLQRQPGSTVTSAEEVARLAIADDEVANEVIRDSSDLLAAVLASAAQTFDPQAIALVITDGRVAAAQIVEARVRESLAANLAGRPQLPNLSVASVGYRRWAQGAGGVALNQYFTPGAISSSFRA